MDTNRTSLYKTNTWTCGYFVNKKVKIQIQKTNGRMDKQMNGRTDGQTDGQTDGWMDKQMDGWMDE